MLGLLRGTFAHGVHPPEHKEATAAMPIRRLPFAPEMAVPLSQHAGAPAAPTVREGQEVVRGEPIAEAGGFVSVPMHAPATGVVSAIRPIPDARGGLSTAIVIRLYPGASQDILYGAPQDVASMSPAEIVAAVQATGVVGLGGAAFPTHVKLAPPEGKRVDTVIANGCECEPYLTTDHRVMIEQPEAILEGMRVAMHALRAARGIIGVEDNKADAVRILREHAASRPEIAVRAIATKYPQGAEKMLIKSLLNREVPPGGLPADVGAAVFNVATLAQIGELLPHRRGLIERVVTVTGPGVARPGNYLMALGTPLRFALEHAGLLPDTTRVILGGPMMGPAAPNLDIPITKGITGILAFTTPEHAAAGKVQPCIKCGECLAACPLNLNPSRLGALARKEQYETMAEQFHLFDCFECGCCGYVCPSNIPLVQYFRMAKSVVRSRKAAS